MSKNLPNQRGLLQRAPEGIARRGKLCVEASA